MTLLEREPAQDRERLLRILEADDVDGLDSGESLDLDSTACLLLRRYQRDGDVEAFALLCDLTRERLLNMACHLASGERDPEALATAVFARLFRGWRSPRLLVLSFFSLAAAIMRREVGTAPVTRLETRARGETRRAARA